MDDPALEYTTDLGSEDLEHGTWIVVLKADEMPHVCMVQHGVCFSLEHDGNHRYPADKLRGLIARKRIPTLLCKLPREADGPLEPAFAAYDGLEGDTNCFVPVRDHCATWFPAARGCDYVFELAPLLDAAGKVERFVGLHLPEAGGNRHVLPRYDQHEIRARIADVRRSLTGG